jgi:SAM-dependent methyltransferase
VARDLAARGNWVVGLDSSPTLARFAKEEATGPSYFLADATALPFPDESFDLVVVYNSLMDVEDLAAAVSEAARVLTRPGRFCSGVTHPFADTGEFIGEGPNPRRDPVPGTPPGSGRSRSRRRASLLRESSRFARSQGRSARRRRRDALESALQLDRVYRESVPASLPPGPVGLPSNGVPRGEKVNTRTLRSTSGRNVLAVCQ